MTDTYEPSAKAFDVLPVSYDNANLEAIVDRLKRAAPTAVIDSVALRKELVDLLIATGIIATDERAKVFKIAVGDVPTGAEIGKYLQKLATALSTKLRKEDAASGPALAKAITTKLHTRLSATGNRRASELSMSYYPSTRMLTVCGLDDESDVIHRAAADLAKHVELEVRRGPKKRHLIDSLLFGLAGLFADLVREDPLDLPHSEGSHFIQFAHLALMPVLNHTQAEGNALAQRWEELKALSLKEFRPG